MQSEWETVAVGLGESERAGANQSDGFNSTFGVSKEWLDHCGLYLHTHTYHIPLCLSFLMQKNAKNTLLKGVYKKTALSRLGLNSVSAIYCSVTPDESFTLLSLRFLINEEIKQIGGSQYLRGSCIY